jgi:hypothetical protein
MAVWDKYVLFIGGEGLVIGEGGVGFAQSTKAPKHQRRCGMRRAARSSLPFPS